MYSKVFNLKRTIQSGNLERERGLGQLLLQWPSTHGPRADQPYFYKADQSEDCEINEGHRALKERVNMHFYV
jgi:hypothetical protein